MNMNRSIAGSAAAFVFLATSAANAGTTDAYPVSISGGGTIVRWFVGQREKQLG